MLQCDLGVGAGWKSRRRSLLGHVLLLWNAVIMQVGWKEQVGQGRRLMKGVGGEVQILDVEVEGGVQGRREWWSTWACVGRVVLFLGCVDMSCF